MTRDLNLQIVILKHCLGNKYSQILGVLFNFSHFSVIHLIKTVSCFHVEGPNPRFVQGVCHSAWRAGAGSLFALWGQEQFHPLYLHHPRPASNTHRRTKHRGFARLRYSTDKLAATVGSHRSLVPRMLVDREPSNPTTAKRSRAQS